EQRSRLIYDAIGSSITYHNALSIIENLYELDIITEREKEIMKIAINDRSLISIEEKNKSRADILKGMVMVILS
ncbi:MAG: CtsR family transcriptional regulator, partial [Clostridium paraputrificum]